MKSNVASPPLVNARIDRLFSAGVVRASVRALPSARDGPSTVALADALGWDAGQDDHARRTHVMVSEALAEAGVFGEDWL